MALKDNLKRLRQNAGYEQAKEFAKAAGIPYSSYAVYERGSWPNEANLLKIASTLQVSIDELLGYSVQPQDEWEKCLTYLRKWNVTGIDVVDDLGDISIKIPVTPGLEDSSILGILYTSKKELIDIIKLVDDHFIEESEKSYQRLFYWYLSSRYGLNKQILESRYNGAIIELLLRLRTAKGEDREKIERSIKKIEDILKVVQKRQEENAENVTFDWDTDLLDDKSK